MFKHPFFCLPEGNLSNKFNRVLFVTPENTIGIDKEVVPAPSRLVSLNAVDHLITGNKVEFFQQVISNRNMRLFINSNRKGDDNAPRPIRHLVEDRKSTRL